MLEEADSDMLVAFSSGGGPTGPHSYRGYYSDLGLKTSGEPTTVSELLDTLQEAHGSEFTGYKGGKFTMGDDTPLWRAEWGSTGEPIVNFERDGQTLVLVLGDSN